MCDERGSRARRDVTLPEGSRRRTTRVLLWSILVWGSAACRDPNVDGFLASEELACPSGFSVSRGRCYRMPPPTEPGQDAGGAVRDAGASVPEALAGVSAWDARPDAVSTDSSPRPHDAGVVADPPVLDPEAIEGSPVAVKLAAGANHDCAVMQDGTVRCWGRNDEGQVGQPKTSIRQEYAQTVPGLRDVVGLAAGREHTCAVTRRGAVLCWGVNGNGQFGNQTFVSKWFPDPAAPATDVEGAGPIWIAPSGPRTCVATRAGSLSCWGGNLPGGGDWNTPRPFRGLSQITAMSMGDRHSCAIVPAGDFSCWAEDLGKGLGNSGYQVPLPVQVPSAIANVAVDYYSTCFLSTEGVLACSSILEAPIAAIADGRDVVAGYGHMCVLRTGGTVWCSGAINTFSVLGRETETVGPVVNVSGAKAIAAGRDHNCAIVARGEVRCWGAGYAGPNSSGPFVPPVTIPGTGGL